MTAVLDLFRLDGRTAIVTGGAGLLGRQFCSTLVEAGAAVVVADLRATELDAAVAMPDNVRAKYLFVNTDITNPASVEELLAKTKSRFGSVDILVNSAALDPKFGDMPGANNAQRFEKFPLDVWKQALDVNLTGMFLCCQAVTKSMLEAQAGVIINICSIYGLVGPDQRLYKAESGEQQFKPAYYTVTKAGVLGLTKYLSAYFAEKNIRVNALTPGGVFQNHDDEFVKRYAARTVLGRMGAPNDMNGALLFLASDASAYVTGANLIVDGGWTAW